MQSLAPNIAGQDLGPGSVSDVYWLIENVNPVPPGRAIVFSGPPVYKLQRKITVSVSALAPRFGGGVAVQCSCTSQRNLTVQPARGARGYMQM